MALVVLVGLPLVVLVLGDGAGAGFVPWLRRACEAVAARAWPIFVGIGLWWTGSALWLAWMTLVLRKAGAALVAKAVPGPDHKPS